MGLWKEFRRFLTQANFINIAVGLVVGLAVVGVVTSLVTNVINPAIGVAFHANFNETGKVTINNSTFYFGTFFGAIVNFIIIMGVVFLLIVAPYNRYLDHKKARESKNPTTRECPECLSTIPIAARRCASCGQPVAALPETTRNEVDSGSRAASLR